MIAGPHLGELVFELEVLQGLRAETMPASATSLDEALEGRLEAIREKGLAAIPTPTLRRLLREPQLLLELQDHVLSAGAAYWDQKLAESDELTHLTQAGWQWLAKSPVLVCPASASRRAE
jgi:hypothetical protein